MLFCADYDAHKWKMVWNDWTYCEAVEFSVELSKRNKERNDELEELRQQQRG